jgi:hypothetical protein
MLTVNSKSVTAYRPSSASAQRVEFSNEMMHVTLVDGRVISAPIAWFARLKDASVAQLQNFEIGPGGLGIYWPDLDEDLSVAGLLAGADAQAE